MIEYILRIHNDEISNVENPRWLGYVFAKEKKITKDVKSGNVRLTKMGEPFSFDKTVASAIRYSPKEMIEDVKTKKSYSEDTNAIALLGKVETTTKKSIVLMETHRGEFQFYRLELEEGFELKKYRESR